MLQLELYVDGVDLPEKLLTTVFEFISVEPKDGWRLLQHKDKHDVMLFDPNVVAAGIDHWPNMKAGAGGMGIEIVLCVDDATSKRARVEELGFMCSELKLASWGSLEFIFRLKEGYLFRIKQIMKK